MDVITKFKGRYETTDGLAYADVEKTPNVWHIGIIESSIKGGGTALINKIIEDAKIHNVEKITLTTTEQSGWGFFDKMGFKEVGDKNDPYDIPMVLILNKPKSDNYIRRLVREQIIRNYR